MEVCVFLCEYENEYRLVFFCWCFVVFQINVTARNETLVEQDKLQSLFNHQDKKTVGIHQAGPIKEDDSRSQWSKFCRVEYLIGVCVLCGGYSWFTRREKKKTTLCNVVAAPLPWWLRSRANTLKFGGYPEVICGYNQVLWQGLLRQR